MVGKLLVVEAVDAFKSTIESAAQCARSLSLVEYSCLSFNTKKLSKEWTKAFLNKEKKRLKDANISVPECAIYTVVLRKPMPSSKIWAALKKCKENRKLGKMNPNLCAINLCNDGSNVMYVGRSFSPWRRIHQHLNESESATYALHMQQWAIALELDIEVRIYEVPSYKNTPEMERAMNVLEMGLWDHYRPILGRRGDK